MATRLYGILWRWHFLAGMVACPIIFVLAVTGALYAFQPELDRWIYSDLLVVDPDGPRRPIDELLAAAPPTCTYDGVGISPDADRSVAFTCADGDHREVFVDPYRGDVLGHRIWDDSVFGIVLALHWELMLEDRGRLVIEWGTSWTMLLLLSGAVLWWPRGKRRGGGVAYPRRELRGRQWLRDLHAVFGAYAVPALFAIVATGLFWTAMAGEDRWHKLTEDAVSDAWEVPHVSTVIEGQPRIGVDEMLASVGIDLATERRELYIAFPHEPDAPYSIFTWDGEQEHPSWQQTLWVDAYSGALIDEVSWDEHSALGKLDTSGYSIHVGAFLSLPGRIAALLAALILAALCITGPWMWWKRRPRGGLGVPPRARKPPWALFVVIAGLGWVLPTVGYTLIAIVAIEVVLLGIRFGTRRLSVGRRGTTSRP